MANGSGTGRITAPGVVLGGLLFVFIVISLWMFLTDRWWFPELASVHGAAVDRVFMAVLIVTGVAFVAVQGLLAYFVARFGANGEERASYWHDSPKGEFFLILGTAVTLAILVFMGSRVWADIYFSDPPEDAIIVEATGMQFQWVFRYPGPDGEFGRTDASLVSASTGNVLGLDRTDPPAADDIVSIGNIHVVQNQPVHMFIRSIDVIHDFHLPNFRVKQDAVPGLTVENWFTPTRTGQFEVACAELCGNGHFRMRGFLTVDPSQAELQQWLDEQLAFQ